MILILIQNLSFYNKNYYLKDFFIVKFYIKRKTKEHDNFMSCSFNKLSPSKKFFTNNYQNSILPD